MTRLRNALFLATKHLAFYRGRTAMLVVALGCVAGLPLILQALIERGTQAMMARARTTPLVIGAKGSELDLVVSSMYFSQPAPRPITVGESDRLRTRVDGIVVPLHLGFTAQRAPLVGTTLDYFDMRGLVVTEGRTLQTLGECVVGASVAARLALHAGGAILTDATDPYNLAGTIPLRLRVVGVLAPAGTADDRAVFVDLKTAWTVEGIGHGHQRAETIVDANDLLGRLEGHVVTSERLRHYEEITPESAASFHFHGDPATFPVHAFLLWPASEKAATLVQGSFQRPSEALQIVKPVNAMERLLREILRLQRFLNAIFVVVGAVTLAIVTLVIALSIRLRRDELTTMVRLGAARGTVVLLISAECFLIVLLSALLVACGVAIALPFGSLAERLLVGG